MLLPSKVRLILDTLRYFHFTPFLTTKCLRLLRFTQKEVKFSSISHGQYHGYWWRRQVISSQGIDLVCIDYFTAHMGMVNKTQHDFQQCILMYSVETTHLSGPVHEHWLLRQRFSTEKVINAFVLITILWADLATFLLLWNTCTRCEGIMFRMNIFLTLYILIIFGDIISFKSFAFRIIPWVKSWWVDGTPTSEVTPVTIG